MNKNVIAVCQARKACCHGMVSLFASCLNILHFGKTILIHNIFFAVIFSSSVNDLSFK